MAIDVLILDDEELQADVISELAQRYDLQVETFTSGIAALAYLEQCTSGELPRAYVVDMNIPIGRGDELIREQASPLAMFHYVAEHGSTEYFVYVTGNVSDHDEGVQTETGARMLTKNKETLEKLKELFQELKDTKSTYQDS
jgi:CheY-like chemotaxis protein